MAISRSLMNRELQANGGIMQVAPREKFGLGSKLKSFVRKIIPNEVAEVATTVAPFVAPFNPAVAAAMSGIGTFDQTGSIGDSLKGGALTYGLGQGARFLGGAGFQQNPFASGGAFTPSGFTQGFSSPIGSETGLGKFFSNRGTEGIKGVSEQEGLFAEGLTGGTEAVTTGSGNNPFGYMDAVDPSSAAGQARAVGDTILKTTVDKSVPIIEGSPQTMSITQSIQKIVNPDSTLNERGTEALNLLKRGTRAAFTKPIKGEPGKTQLDKAAILGALAFTASYAEAKALAAETGIDDDLTEAEYDELTKADKKEEYASYLTDFFAGKKDGGRIGFSEGADQKLIDLADYYMERGLSESEAYETAAKELYKADGGRIGFSEGSGFFKNLTSGLGQIFSGQTQAIMGGDQKKINEFNVLEGYGIDLPQDTIKIIVDGFKKGLDLETISSLAETDAETVKDIITRLTAGVEQKADGGRIGFAQGTPGEPSEIGIMTIDVEAGDDEEDENDLMAGITFSKAERAFLYKKLGSSYTSNKSKSMPNLYYILNDPGSHPADAAILKQIAIMGMKKDGGRIMFAEGTPDKELEKILATDMTISDSSNDPRNMTTEQLIAIIQSGGSTPEMFEELMLRGYTGVDSIMTDNMSDTYKSYSFSPDKKRGGTMEDFLFKLRESNPDIYGEYRRPRKPEGIMYLDKPNMKDGGRIKYAKGANRVSELLILRDEALGKGEDTSIFDAELFQLTGKVFNSIGGLSEIPTGQIRKNNAGVIERDYRDEGGFVPVGIKERADDVPAMLSKNEFVMTADAVRGIGDGDVEKGSKRLYNTMKQAEKVGKA